MRLLTRRRRSLGPIDKAVIGLLCLVLVAGGVVLTVSLWPEKCGEGLEEVGPAGECIGVTDKAFVFDEDLEALIHDVAEENARVEQEWKSPEDGKARVPYVKIALMMPFTEDSSSAMTMELIRHALAGAHLAQLRANQDSDLQYQLLLANDGKDLNHWDPVVKQLAGMTDDESPLVAVVGWPSSTPATQLAADALSKAHIPSVGPVIFSTDMSSEYLFKNSASNEHLVLALDQYLEKNPGSGEGFLVWDSRKHDNYSINLREEYKRRFGEEYGLRQRNSSYLGTIGDDVGIPRRFRPVAQAICLTEADTVFYAGRDRDLPSLISQLAGQANCDHEQEIRIMKVGVGLDPALTTPEVTEDLREARITLVNAADVHPRWWRQNTSRHEPPGFDGFHETFLRYGGAWDLGAKPLDDGYTIMYHDAFQAAAQASDESFSAANEKAGDQPQPDMPSSRDVYRTLVNMSVLATKDGSDCVACVSGASGTFGFDAEPSTDKWAVCKPVPVVLYPERSGRDRSGGDLYRTHQDVFGGRCL